MPLTPSMTLNALTNPVIQMVTATARPARTGGMTSAVTAAHPAPCSTRRRPAGSGRTSSAKPSRQKKATATMNVPLAPPPASLIPTISPSAMAMPPPHGVGTSWEERAPGTSTAARRRSSGIVTGSATITMAPRHITAPVMSWPRTSRILTGSTAFSNCGVTEGRHRQRARSGARPRRARRARRYAGR